MSAKNALLVAAAIAVLGMGVYLFIQVRATPAQASATATPARPTPREPVTTVASDTPKPAASTPPAPPVPGTTKTTWERPVGETPPTLAGSDPDDRKVDMKMDNLMELANKAYDAQDFDQATAIAGKVLSKEPDNVRMLRVMVSSHCIQGDSVVAQQYFEKLPKFDREQMKTRCDRYGVSFKE